MMTEPQAEPVRERSVAPRLIALFGFAAGSTLLIFIWAQLALESTRKHHDTSIIDLWPDRAYWEKWMFDLPAIVGSCVPVLIALWMIVRIVQRKWSALWLMSLPFLALNWWFMICVLMWTMAAVEY